MDDEPVLEQVAGAMEGSVAAKADTDLDMSFDFDRRDLDLDATADTSEILDSDNETHNGAEPEENEAERSEEARHDVVPDSLSTEHVASPNPEAAGAVSAAVDGERDSTPVIPKESAKTESAERELSATSSAKTPRRFEISLPGLPLSRRDQYEQVKSDTIETVKREDTTEAGQVCYHVEFTDGREELVSLACLLPVLRRPNIATLHTPRTLLWLLLLSEETDSRHLPALHTTLSFPSGHTIPCVI